jgi:uncharacterized protein (TIGR03382 family)
MKSLSIGSSSICVLSLAMFAAPAVADIGMYTEVLRYATAAGLTDSYVQGSVSIGAGGTLLSATRPNGQTNWQQQFGAWSTRTPQGPGFLTGAAVDSWMDSNSRGTLSCTWSTTGGTYPGTYQTSADFAPYYIAPTARTYMELTQSSIAQFNDICANGLTGTFTFSTTQDVVQAGFEAIGLFLSGSNGQVFSPTILSGNTFTVNIESALSANSRLYIEATTREVAFQASTNYPFPEVAFNNYTSRTMYMSQPIPAPGALALLGLAGLAGTRRRR